MSKLLTGTAYKVFVCRNQTAPQKVVVLQGAVNNDLREQLLAPLPMEEYLGSKFALCTQWTSGLLQQICPLTECIPCIRTHSATF